MKKTSLLVFIILSWMVFLPASDNCFTIIVGKDASDDGSVLLAHNEDDGGKPAFVDVHQVLSRFHPQQATVQLKNGATIPQVKKTNGFFWIQLPGYEFGDSYFNEHGVVLASNACLSRETNGELDQGGIGFMLRRLITERAQSARHGVEVAGRLIETLGYYSSGRSYAIADAKEAWVLHIVQGKRWVAQRVPDDEVVVIANRFVIHDINLSDRNNFLGSADLVAYAQQTGWYSPQKDKSFSFARAYTKPEKYNWPGNILRQWRGTSLLAKDKFTPDSPLPFSFKPRKKIKITDIFSILRDHYEDTEHDLSDDYRLGSPNSTEQRTICTATTRYSFVSHLRSTLPRELAHVVWIAWRRPDSNAYSPWYFPICRPPEGYNREPAVRAFNRHFSQPEDFFKTNPDFAFSQFDQLSALVDADYKNRIRIVRKEWNNFENYILKNITKKEREFFYLLKRNRTICINLMTNYIHNLEYRKWFMATELAREISLRK